MHNSSIKMYWLAGTFLPIFSREEIFFMVGLEQKNKLFFSQMEFTQ